MKGSVPKADPAASLTGDISQVAEHLFRHEAARLVSVLTGLFGIERWSLAEEVVQEALARALRTWPYHGLPRNPAAWLTQTAKNLARDSLRRERTLHDKQTQLIAFLEQQAAPAHPGASAGIDLEIQDDRLRMMFVCCHPRIHLEDQAALTLKTLCGFSPAEIARAFLTTETAILKRLTRARQRIRQMSVAFEVPDGEELVRRLDGVLHSLYLLFNEGYKASCGERLVREDVCGEAIRLMRLLVEHPAGDCPKARALLALMLLTAARLPTRMDADGNLLRLQEQDRTRWDSTLMAQGMYELSRSAAGTEVSAYHLQAGIAACHCTARDYASTDWARILELYDRLSAFDHSPVVRLNRAVALAEIEGPQAGIDAVNAIGNRRPMESYHLFHAVLGEFESRLHHPRAAAAHFRKARSLAAIGSEKRFLSGRLRAIEQAANRVHSPGRS